VKVKVILIVSRPDCKDLRDFARLTTAFNLIADLNEEALTSTTGIYKRTNLKNKYA